MTRVFPYDDVPDLQIPDGLSVDCYSPAPSTATSHSLESVGAALKHPIGSPHLRELAIGKTDVLIVFDDYSRPTPINVFVDFVLAELHAAGIDDNTISFIPAQGTHRPMTRDELVAKLGQAVVDQYRILEHKWDDESQLVYLGDTEQGVPVSINRIVQQSDLVVGLGAIMPLEVSGFTGGGKILVPGLSGQVTVDEMHWTRIGVPAREVVGTRDNPIRRSIDALARKAGLDFIVNVVLDCRQNIVDAVAGDMTDAHVEGCRRARPLFAVAVPHPYDIVVADSHPFDVEFWQANKALDAAGAFVRHGGVIILVSPCHEGWSRVHAEDILKYGYRSIAEIKGMVADGSIEHKVVGVHMYQVSEAAVEKGRLTLVTSAIPREEVEAVGFKWAPTPQDALDAAVRKLGGNPTVALLQDSARIMPIIEQK